LASVRVMSIPCDSRGGVEIDVAFGCDTGEKVVMSQCGATATARPGTHVWLVCATIAQAGQTECAVTCGMCVRTKHPQGVGVDSESLGGCLGLGVFAGWAGWHLLHVFWGQTQLLTFKKTRFSASMRVTVTPCDSQGRVGINMANVEKNMKR
jgi:hypothetical protein